MNEVHTAICIKLDELERQVNKLAGITPFVDYIERCTCSGGVEPYGHEPGCGTEPGELWWVIDHLRRDLVEDRNVLTLHSRYEYQDWPPQYGTPPADCDRCTDSWPCKDILSLAARHGIEIPA